jgi:uncharacterized Zn ribbon protein
MVDMIQTRICKQCGCAFNGGPRAYYCPSCRVERQREQNKNFKTRKKDGQIRKLGSTDICKKCGKEYIVMSGLQRFCPDCQAPHALEHDRITGIDYYYTNKDKINPGRNEKRRKGTRICAWCGKEFETNTRELTCSAECSRKRKNALWMELYKKKGDK